jgi:hypothetical protein
MHCIKTTKTHISQNAALVHCVYCAACGFSSSNICNVIEIVFKIVSGSQFSAADFAVFNVKFSHSFFFFI